jgi:hypothetical protein
MCNTRVAQKGIEKIKVNRKRDTRRKYLTDSTTEQNRVE